MRLLSPPERSDAAGAAPTVDTEVVRLAKAVSELSTSVTALVLTIRQLQKDRHTEPGTPEFGRRSFVKGGMFGRTTEVR